MCISGEGKVCFPQEQAIRICIYWGLWNFKRGSRKMTQNPHMKKKEGA